MSDTARRVFPLEVVLALLMGRAGDDVAPLLGFFTGRSVVDARLARLLTPLAVGWLVRLYPDLAVVTWDATTPWPSFVANACREYGEALSVPSMPPHFQALAVELADTLDGWEAELHAQREAQRAQQVEMTALTARVRHLEAETAAREKRCASLQAENDALRKKAACALTRERREENTEKDCTTTPPVSASASAPAQNTASPAATVAREAAAEFGFGTSGPDSEGFGF